jgi:resolvase-like protein
MDHGYARVSTDRESVEAQVRQLRAARCKKVFREVASGAKTERAQRRRLLNSLAAGDIVIGDAARSASALDPRPVEHARGSSPKKECGSVSGPPSLVEPAVSEVLLPD